jgi:hypothetical protein
MPLTVRAVETAKPRDKAYKLADERGLYLFVSPTGTKSWRANFTEAGKQQTRTYGRWPAMTLAQARREHQEVREQPEGVAAPAAAAPTFKVVARQWLLKHLPGLSNPKHRGQVEATLERFAYPALGNLPIDTITRVQLTDAVAEEWRSGRDSAPGRRPDHGGVRLCARCWDHGAAPGGQPDARADAPADQEAHGEHPAG